MEIKDIKRIMEMVNKNELTEFSLKENDFELTMKRGAEQITTVALPAGVPAPVAAAPAAAAAPAPTTTIDENEDLIEILSPIVGTFYQKPAPDADDFVRVGSDVSDETVVCIVEAMKVMNEIKAEVSGTIRKMLVDDATPVQYGQPLFLVEPS